MIVRGLLKWPGGKAGLAKHMLPQMPTKCRRIFEPFCGSLGSYLVWCSTEWKGIAFLSDTNPEIINLHRCVRDKPDHVIRYMERFRARFIRCETHKQREKVYYRVRHRFNQEKYRGAKRAACVLFLSATCFNGLYRLNSKGHFNAAFGLPHAASNPSMKYYFTSAEQVHQVSHALRKAQIHKRGFAAIEAKVRKGDFVYLDPPYDDTFTSYTKSGFGPAEQKAVAKLAQRLAQRGAYVLVSNSNTKRVRRLYRKADEIIPVKAASYRIGARWDKGKAKRGVREVLIRFYPESKTRGHEEALFGDSNG